MKSGFKTSEFYVALLGIGGLVVSFARQHCQVNQVEVIAFCGVVISYILGRSWVKRKI